MKGIYEPDDPGDAPPATKRREPFFKQGGLTFIITLVGMLAALVVILQNWRDVAWVFEIILALAYVIFQWLRSAIEGLASLGAVFWAVLFTGWLVSWSVFEAAIRLERRLRDITLLLEEQKREREQRFGMGSAYWLAMDALARQHPNAR